MMGMLQSQPLINTDNTSVNKYSGPFTVKHIKPKYLDIPLVAGCSTSQTFHPVTVGIWDEVQICLLIVLSLLNCVKDFA